MPNDVAPAARFTDRRALVVGGGTGMGLAVARRLATEGAEVVLADVDEALVATAVATLPGSRHHAVRLDVTSRASVDGAVGGLDRLDVLVHVAGGDRVTPPFVDCDDDTWTELLELNLLGAVRTCRATVPLLQASERGPAVVVVSSVNALVALGELPYSAAKAALLSLVANLAVELAPTVRVNAVVPGTVRTRVWDEQPGGADRMRPLYPLGRVGEPADVAGAVSFLASEDAAWVTGHALPVEGGLLTGGSLRRLFA